MKLKFFLLHRSGNSMLFYWIKHSSESLRKISFRASGSYAKITYIVLIHMSQGRTGLFCLYAMKKQDSSHLLVILCLEKHKRKKSSRLTLYHGTTANQVKECVTLKRFKLQLSFFSEFLCILILLIFLIIQSLKSRKNNWILHFIS